MPAPTGVEADYAEKLKENVGRRISELRERAGFTQDDVAEALGTSTSNYQRIEYGGQNLTLAMMAKIARALDVEVGAFFTPVESTPRPQKAGRSARRSKSR